MKFREYLELNEAKEQNLDIDGVAGKMRVVFVPKGGKTQNPNKTADKPTVLFYDLRHRNAPEWKKNGQFISSYFASSLVDEPKGGLNLDSGEKDWGVDSKNMSKVFKWLKKMKI